MILGSLALAAPEVEAVPFDHAAACVEAAGPVQELGPVQPADRLALLVGVPCHEDPSIPSLQYSSSDAARLGSVLEERGFVVHRLTTSVTRQAFEDALEALSDALTRDGELVVYFSGHGVLRTVNGELERYLVFSDADLGRIEATGLSSHELEARVQGIHASRRTVIQDTCYAAGERGKGLAGPSGAKSLSIPAPALGPVDTRLYASRFYEIATEEPELGGSVYTTLLVRALQDASADLDGDGCVGLLEAHAHATPATTAWRRGFQHPEWEGALDRARCGPGTRGVLLEDGVLRAVEPGSYGSGMARTRIAAGEWTTVRRRPGWGALVGLSAGARPFGSAPVTLGGEVALQRFRPRWMGWIGLRGAGAMPREVAGVRFSGAEGTLRLGALTAWGLGIGPVLEVGALVLHPKTETARLPLQAAPLAGLSARFQGGWGPVYLAGEAGLGSTLDEGAERALRVIVWPTVVGVLGVRL